MERKRPLDPVSAAWLAGGGEMGELIRSMDWSETPLGPLAGWPQSLRTAVSLALASSVPISIVWGPCHTQIYNDGYRPICGARHPLSMGQDFTECWASEWPVIGEAFESALRGETRVLENQRVFLDRNGSPQEAFFTFFFSPIRDETGGVAGLFHPLIETTAQVLGGQELRRLREREDRWRLALESAELGTWNIDFATDVLTTDERFRLIFHGSDEPITTEQVFAAIHPGDRQRVRDAVAAATRPDDPARYSEEYRVVHPDGTTHWVLGSGRASFEPTAAGPRVVSFDGMVSDVTARKESETRFRQIADTMAQMIWVTRPDGYHEWYNKRWYEFTGVPEGATDGEGWNRMFHPGDQELAFARWRHSLATGELYEIEYRLRHHSGEYRWVLGRALPIRDAEGRIERWFGTCTDIDAMKQLTVEREILLDAERIARAEAEAASRMKDEFLATLSHELRTPLNAILGWSQILKLGGTADAEDVAEGLRTIERNARAQTRIIDDLLDMSRIISGKIRLDVQRVDLASVVHAAVETVQPAADAKSVHLQTLLDPRAGPVGGDPSRLQQVFWNLLSNAVKFTPRGGRVQVLLERAGPHVEVSVTDTGEGIDPGFLPHVFERFRQSDSSTTRRHGGLGLGLAIVKQLVELHGGTVRAESPGKGQGARVTVALPLMAVASEPAAERRHSGAGGVLPSQDLRDRIAGLKVLVVDDEPDARSFVKRLLENCRVVVTAAGSAEEAMRLFQEERPDVLISDIGMPGEDGYALIRRLRALGSDRGGETPAIALTAYARAEDRINAVMAGFQHHVAKPVEPAELIAMIASLVRTTG